jgi:tocopherol O-methyltransferase
MANKKAKAIGLIDQVQFQVADVNLWQPQPGSIDVIWIMEGSEHFRDQKGFFERCAFALNPGGILAICAWLRGDRLFRREDEELITTIGRAMLSASLNTLEEHKAWMRDAGLNVETAQDITQKVAPTWDYCSRLAECLPLRCLLPFVDSSSRRFIRSFPLMKRAYAEGVMAFGLFVAKKCTT